MDELVSDVRKINEYFELKDYIEGHFGTFEGVKFVDYGDIEKKVYLKLEENVAEFCALFVFCFFEKYDKLAKIIKTNQQSY